MKREITRKNYVNNREQFIINLCKNKKVLHIGACDTPYTKNRFKNNNLLFQQIEKVTNMQLGIDISIEDVEFLNKKGLKNIKYFDMNKLDKLDFSPQIIVFGDTLEHLMNLEVALLNLKKIMNKNTILIISVPNATMFLKFVNCFLGKITEHEDHVVSFNYFTLRNLLKNNNFKIESIFFSDKLTLEKNVFDNKNNFFKSFLIKTINFINSIFVFFFPLFSQCLIITCKKR